MQSWGGVATLALQNPRVLRRQTGKQDRNLFPLVPKGDRESRGLVPTGVQPPPRAVGGSPALPAANRGAGSIWRVGRLAGSKVLKESVV